MRVAGVGRGRSPDTRIRSLRLCILEARRDFGRWIVPALAFLAWFLARDSAMSPTVRLWGEMSIRVRDGVALLGPAAGGLAAWSAGRDRRRGVDELLSTTPQPQGPRRLIGWSATTSWSFVAYGVFALYMFVWAALGASWGGPYWWPLIVGPVALLAHTSIGYAVGSFVPSRFTAPVVAVALFWVQANVGESHQPWFRYLSPTTVTEYPLWTRIAFEPGPAQTLFLLGLSGAALGAVLVRGQRRRVLYLPLGLGLVLTSLGLVLVLDRVHVSHDVNGNGRNVFGQVVPVVGTELIPYQPVCTNDPLPVCVHPAYRALLDQTAVAANQLVVPLLGVPGAPKRIEQRIIPPDDPDVLDFFPGQYARNPDLDVYRLAMALVHLHGRTTGPDDDSEAQQALAIWLLDRAAIPTGCADRVILPDGSVPPLLVSPGTCDAANRFGALPDARQRIWLDEHYTDMRDGRLTLADLP